MSTVTLSVDADGRIATITMARPQVLNAMTLAMAIEMHEVIDAASADPGVRAIILTGEGRGFCAGHDLDEIPQTSADVASATRLQRAMAGLVTKLRSIPQPVVAAVDGPACGGGFSLALACELRVCSDRSVFNAAFVRLGLSGTDMGISYLLPRIVGFTRSSELLLTGRTFGAAEAERLGVVLSRHTTREETMVAARTLATAVADNSPLGVTATKRNIWASLETGLTASIELENNTQIMLLQSADHREAVAAFLEERTPVFRGR